jgi:hypothetical protein
MIISLGDIGLVFLPNSNFLGLSMCWAQTLESLARC